MPILKKDSSHIGAQASFNLLTSDGIEISASHLKRGFESLIVVCPGFFNSRKDRWIGRAAGIAASRHDVIVFDFRGHGESKGKFLWSAKEHLDVLAVLHYAQSKGYKAIGILAFSLGAAASINAAARCRIVKSMVLISAPCSFWKIDYHFWEPEMLLDLKGNIDCGWEGKGANIGNILLDKPEPLREIKKIKNSAIFFIHGSSDWVIKDYHSRMLYNAADVKQKRIKIIKNGLHAERLIEKNTVLMNDLILGWFDETLTKKGE